jgi:hypothetical protein
MQHSFGNRNRGIMQQRRSRLQQVRNKHGIRCYAGKKRGGIFCYGHRPASGIQVQLCASTSIFFAV